mgnify:CR=1 FL=1|tara:strand:- start:487 stop:1119 length:633 start_codon:yes stop_codon:yes gene_type:complete
MKIKVNIPENLNEITLGQYQQWLRITENKEIDEFLKQKMVEIFCNIPLDQVIKIQALEIDAIVEILSKMFDDKPQLQNTFELDGVEYGFIYNLDEMSSGEFVDLDNYLSDFQQIHTAMKVLYRPIKHKTNKGQYLIEDYTGKENYDSKSIKLSVVLGSLFFFKNLKKELQSNILNYLATQQEVPISRHLRLSLLNGVGTIQSMQQQVGIY